MNFSRRCYSLLTGADLQYRANQKLRESIYLGELDVLLPAQMHEKFMEKKSMAESLKIGAKQKLRRTYAELIVKKSTPGFRMSAFEEEVKKLYFQYINAILRGDEKSLRQITTKHCFDSIKSFITREKDRRIKLEWEITQVESEKILDIVPARFNDINGDIVTIIQAVYLFDAHQRLNRNIGDANPESVPFQSGESMRDIVVFEKNISNPYDIWKVAGKLDALYKEVATVTESRELKGMAKYNDPQFQ